MNMPVINGNLCRLYCGRRSEPSKKKKPGRCRDSGERGRYLKILRESQWMKRRPKVATPRR